MRKFMAVLLGLIFSGTASPQSSQYFTIKVVDDQTGRGVPLVELRTTNEISYFTDSNGIVAFYEPGLMGQTVNLESGAPASRNASIASLARASIATAFSSARPCRSSSRC
jgi:hypothetical protein